MKLCDSLISATITKAYLLKAIEAYQAQDWFGFHRQFLTCTYTYGHDFAHHSRSSIKTVMKRKMKN